MMRLKISGTSGVFWLDEHGRNDDATRGAIGFVEVSYKYKAFVGILFGTKQEVKEESLREETLLKEGEKSTKERGRNCLTRMFGPPS